MERSMPKIEFFFFLSGFQGTKQNLLQTKLMSELNLSEVSELYLFKFICPVCTPPRTQFCPPSHPPPPVPPALNNRMRNSSHKVKPAPSPTSRPSNGNLLKVQRPGQKTLTQRNPHESPCFTIKGREQGELVSSEMSHQGRIRLQPQKK